jgi:hypothetical protein
MPLSAQFQVPAAPRLRRLLAAGLRGRATGRGAVFLVALLAIDSPAADRGRSLPHVDQNPTAASRHRAFAVRFHNPFLPRSEVP